MTFFYNTIVIALALGVNCAHFKIPEVENTVNEILHEFSNTVHYAGNGTQSSHVEKRQSTPYWYEMITHQGISAFGPSGYQVYRNVKDYGAKGDGVTDDTAAINAAMNAGGRCGQGCSSSTVTPAVIYFPSGTYILSSSIIDQYYTQVIGNPNNPPVLKATAGFSGFGLIDGDKYYTANLNWDSTNVFWRQVRNFVFDLTSVPIGSSICGIHWPTAQATSLQNLVFQMSSAAGTQHVGIFSESGMCQIMVIKIEKEVADKVVGSAGFMNDLTFNGGNFGLQIGNQQFTMRNIVFNNCVTAISQLWSWGWLYQGLTINNCQKGVDISSVNSGSQLVGSITIIDSTFTNTPVGVITAFSSTSFPNTAGSLILENVFLSNVGIAVQEAGGATLLAGNSGSTTIAGWGQGNEYTPNGPQRFQGSFTPMTRPELLLNGNVYYFRSKPQYNNLPVSSFLSVRSAGATGNGVADDTAALQTVINNAAASGSVVYFDAGTYRITSTLQIPPGSKLVGEAYPIIVSSGPFFNDMNSPQPVVRVGNAGQAGKVEWTDTIVSTQGTQAGAIAIEWNLASSGAASGMWDVHVRIGGFAGSNLQVGQCPKTPGNLAINTACVGAYMLMHVTASASNLYLENVWLWTADHDVDSSDNNQITIYSGRGLHIESTAGNFWLVGTAVEHNTLYQYQLANTQNIFMGFIQTETPAPTPFSVVPTLNDPDFASSCAGQSGNCANAWGLRILNSSNILVYGGGLYSFFNDYNTTCSNGGGPETCQSNIFSLERSLSNINVYCLNTVGTTNMITQAGKSLALYSDNVNIYSDTIALFNPGVVSYPISSPGATILCWTYRGCYTDSISARILGNTLTVNGGAAAMTIGACLNACQTAGFSLAGIEYSGECSQPDCDNALRNGGGPAPDGAAQCNMSCNGNKTEICGGPNRLDLYSSSACTSAPIGTSWNSKGCYSDSISARTLSIGPVSVGGATTVQLCQAACKALGYVYAGVEYAVECWCDNALRNGGGPAANGLDLYTFGF
ncbi:hypothetical protein G7Y89_g2624 [Cudoniella acicularis]|uniref:WSC domain-containing protein n=1 Tax=Cudoniella acicularis TaxID=354080 RepID=A0A8H4W8G6_9HELO|nr:hypothetical protein G7Y89_g2624 [Cudoniella acicularis]